MADFYKTSAEAGAEVRRSGQTGIAPAPQSSTQVLVENKPRTAIAPPRESVDPAFDAYLSETRSPQREAVYSADPAFDAYLSGKTTLVTAPSQEVKPEVGFVDSVQKGLAGLKLTWDFLSNKLETAVTGDGSTTAPILQKSVDEYKSLASDPRIQEVIQLGNEAPNYYEGAKAMLKYAASNPGMVVNFLGEQLPAMVGGGVVGKAVQGVAKGAALSAGTSAATAGAVGMGTFGATTNATAVVLGSLGTNYVQGLDKFNGDKNAAADYASTKTLAEVPANAIAGMFMGVNPLSRFSSAAPIASTAGNVAFQAGVQGTGGALGAYQAAQSVGEEAGRGELLAEFLGEAAFAPVEVLTSGQFKKPSTVNPPAAAPQGSVTVEQAPERFNNAPEIPTMGEATLAPIPQGLTNEEFFGMAQARQTPGILSALYANGDEGTRRQLQTYANKTGMKLDLENASKNESLINAGNKFIESNPTFTGMFQERLGEFYERTRPKDMPQAPIKTPPKDETPFVERKRLDDTLAQQEQAIAQAQVDERKPAVQSNVTPAPTQIGLDPTQTGNVSQNVQNREADTPIQSEPSPLTQLVQAEAQVRQGLPVDTNVDTQEVVSETTPNQVPQAPSVTDTGAPKQKTKARRKKADKPVPEVKPPVSEVQQNPVPQVEDIPATPEPTAEEVAAAKAERDAQYAELAKRLPESKKLLDEANRLRETEQMTIDERNAAQAAINKYEFGKAKALIKEAKKRKVKSKREPATPFEPPELIDERLRNFQLNRDAKPIAKDVVEQDMMRAQAEFNRVERQAEFEKEPYSDGKAAVLINRLINKDSEKDAQDIRPVAELLNKKGDVVSRIYSTRDNGFFKFTVNKGSLDGAAPDNFNQKPSVADTLDAFIKKTPFTVRRLERLITPSQKEIGFNPDQQAELNKFNAQAERIMTTMFTGSTVTDTLNDLRTALKRASKSQWNFFKYNKKRSDDEYIFTLFEGGRSDPTGPVINTQSGGMAEIGGKKRGGKSSATARLAAAIQSAQEGDVRARASLMKLHLAKILDELEGVRQQMEAAGFDKEAIDRVVGERENSIKAIQEDETPKEYNYERNPSKFLSALDEFNTVVDEQVEPDSFDLPFPDIARSDRIQSAVNAIKAMTQDGDLNAYWNEMAKPRAEREFQFSDFRAAAKKMGFDLSLVDVDISQKPAFHTRLSEFVYGNRKGLDGNYEAREQWVSSYNQITYLLEDRPDQLAAFEKTITPNERRIIEYVNGQRRQLGGRIEGVLKEKGEFFDDAKDAFPGALFNRFRLDEMRPDNIPDNYREALRSIVGGNEQYLYNRWLADVYDAVNARRDLEPQIMSRLNDQEKAAVANYTRKIDGNLAQNLKASERATYSSQLDSLPNLPAKAYDNFKQAIGTSEIKDLPKILQRAREVDELKRLSKDKKQFSDAMAALLGQVYHNDAMSSFPLDQILDRVEVMNNEALPQVSESEVREYQDRLARQGEDYMAVDDIQQAILFEKLARSASATSEETFVAEQAADSSTQPENQARLGGDISYKRGVNSHGPASLLVKAHLEQVTYDWPVQPNLEVYYNVGQMPDSDIKDRILARAPTGDIKGAIDPETGKVYLFSQRLQSMEDAEFVLFHELYGHWGLRYFLGDKIDAFLNNQYKVNQKVKAEADRQFEEALDTNTPMSRIESIEEAISDMAAKGDTKLFKELIGRLVAWLRENDMYALAQWLDSKGDKELAYVLSQARKVVRTQQGISPMHGAPSEVLFARNKQPVEIYALRNEEVRGYARLNPVLGEWVVYTKKEDGEWGYILMDDYNDVYTLLKPLGTISRSKERVTRIEKDPTQFVKIPDFSETILWNNFVRKSTFEIQNQYQPIFEVAEYLDKNGVPNTVIRDLKLYEARLKYFVDKMAADYEMPIKKLLKIIADKGGDLQGVDRYLAARHAEERNDYVNKITEGNNTIGSGYAKRAREVDGEIVPGYLDILEDAEKAPYFAELQELGALTDRMSEEHVNYMLQTELIDDKTAARLMRYKHYVNLSGNKKLGLDKYDDTALEGSGFNFKGREVKSATGRGTEAVDVLGNTMNAYLSTLIRGQKANINRAIVRMLEQANDVTYARVEPIKEKKKLNVDRIITDSAILRAIGDKPTEESGRKYLKDLKNRIDAGVTSDEAAQLELIARIDEAETMMMLDPNVAKTARLRVDKSMVNAGKLTPDGYVSLVEDPNIIKDKNVIVARFGGKPVLVSFEERATKFVQALSGASQQRRGDLIDLVGAWGRMFGQMLTSWNPAWVLPNGGRDFETAIASMSADPNIGFRIAQRIKDEWAPAYSIAFREHIIANADETGGWAGKRLKAKKANTQISEAEAELIDAFKKYGGETFFMDYKGLNDTLKQLSISMYGPQTMQEKVQKSLENVGKLMELTTLPMETAPRLATFKILREEFLQRNLDKGMDRDTAWEEANIEAALYAKEVTVNFNMKGNNRVLRALYVFFNPAVQGTVRMFRNYSRGEKGVARFLPSNSFAKVGGTFIALGFLGNFLARGLGGEAEDKKNVDKLDQIAEYKRATSLIIAPDIPGAAIPIAYGWNVFYAMGHYMADVMLGKLKVEEAANRVLKAAFDAFSPLGSGSESDSMAGFIMDTVTPTILQAPKDLDANKNRFGAPIFKEQSPFSETKEADSWMHFDTVNPISKYIMQGLNKATGGSRYDPGLIDFNPAAVDYLISSYLPGLVNEAYKGAGLIVRAVQGEDIKRAPLPLIDRMSAIVPPNYDAGAMRRISEQVSTLHAEYNSTQTSNARRREITQQHPGLFGVHMTISRIDQDVKKLNQQLKAIEESDRSDSYKVEARNRIKKAQDEMFKRGVKIAIEGGFRDAVVSNATEENLLNNVGRRVRGSVTVEQAPQKFNKARPVDDD